MHSEFRVVLLGLLLFVSNGAWAQLDVVATTANMGMLARTIGGEQVRVTVLAPPDRDAHYLEARPSMMAALRRADLLVAVGAELEVGWLPAALGGAHNPAVLPGRPGYFEGAAQVDLIETGVAADRAGGDVHPEGNPHFYLDPVRVAQAGVALAERMGQLDPDNADAYAARAAAFAAAVDARLPGWRKRLVDAVPVLAYHKDVNYLFDRFSVPIADYIEPLPGIPPTARHLASLVGELRGSRGVIVHMPFQPQSGPRFLARELGWPVVRRSGNVSVRGTGDDYLVLIDGWVEALAEAR